MSIFHAAATHALWHRLRHALLRLIAPHALAGSVLGFGVVLSIAWLVSPLSARPPRADLVVDPVGALLFTALAAALWLSTRMPRLSHGLALAVAAVSFAGMFGVLPPLFAARLPIDAAFSFALCAGAFVFRHQPRRGMRTSCAVALRGVMLLAGVDLLAALSGVRYPFDAYDAFRMGMGGAIAMLMLAAALLAMRTHGTSAFDQTARIVARRSAMVLGTIGLLVLVVTYGRLENLVVQSFTSDYQAALRSRTQAMSSGLREDHARIIEVAKRSSLERILWDLQATGNDEYNLGLARQRLAASMSIGYTALRLSNAFGEQVVTVGEFVRFPEFSAQLRTSERAHLLWKDGVYYLRSTVPMKGDSGDVYGFVTGELPLAWMKSLERDTSFLGKHGVLITCADAMGTVECLPTPGSLATGTRSLAPGWPIAQALAGHHGVGFNNERSGVLSVVAYGPVGELGLGTTMELPTAVLFGPLRRQLLWLLPAVALLVMLGVWIVRVQVVPLVERLRASEREALAAQQRLLESERRIRLIADSIPAMVAYLTRDERFIFANRGYEHAFGVSSAALVGQSAAQVLGEAHSQSAPHIAAVLAGQRVQFERSVHAADGLRHELVDYVPDFDATGGVAGFFSLVQDITRNKQAELRFKALSEVDTLTGLPNRRHFEAQLALAVERQRARGGRLAVLFIDVDRFKQINDSLGHAVGDLVLKEFAQRLKSGVRGEDTVARLAGDEFVVLLWDVPHGNEGELVAAKILTALRAPMVHEGRVIALSSSIGVATLGGADLDGAELMQRADSAVYLAKAAGRGCYRVHGSDKGAKEVA